MIKGGLGNQMSQYAFYLSLRNKFGESVKALNLCFSTEHNGLELPIVFNAVKTKFINNYFIYLMVRIMASNRFPLLLNFFKGMMKKLRIDWINEDYKYSFRPEVFHEVESDYLFFLGGWHCDRYFIDIEKEIRGLYKFDLNKLTKEGVNIIEQIINSESVSIHVRRGDYQTVGSKLFGPVCDLSYFMNAIDKVKNKLGAVDFFVFSDDLDWVKKNLKINATYVESNSRLNSWQDMMMMSCCKHNIISNSSFSWWAAWLNKNPNKIIICPSKFISTEDVTDVYPESWIKIG